MKIRCQLRHQQLLQHRRFGTQQRTFFGDESLMKHFHRGAHHGACIHLAVAGLQAVQNAFFNGKFKVLNFVVMRLQALAQRDQLAVDVGHFVLHLGQRLGGADAGNHVFALGIDQILAIHHVLAGAGVAGETDTGARIVAHVAKNHGAHAHCRAIGLGFGHLELPAVVNGALAHPRAKYRRHRNLQLLKRILRERLAGMVRDDGQKFARQLLQMLGIEVQVRRRAVFALDGRHFLVKMFIVDVERNLAKKLDETAVGIISKTLVAGLADQARQRNIVETQVKNGVHHARHRHGRARAHRNQQRVLAVAKALAGFFLQCGHMGSDFIHQPLRQTVFFQIGIAGLGAGRETGRHIQTNLRHLAQIGTFATQKHFVLAVALFKGKNIFRAVCHDVSRSKVCCWLSYGHSA
ncbi:hypothetical protein GALL_435750 [mine drainage metagenome]|uniref:Uncharacterized protein n=1 Tax=mine drainage metagenome TaxID=410659 RepID=A0A1J5PT26_9ZZZZ